MATTLAVRRPLSTTSWRLDPLSALRDEISEFRSRFWGDDDGWAGGAMAPSLDVAETESAIEVRMDVPGIKAKDLDIQLNANLLTIRGQRNEEREEKGKTYHRVERVSGEFSRTVPLPCTVDEDKVNAEYRDGVLIVTLPKTEASKACKIKVKG